jgi:hypothetical protein
MLDWATYIRRILQLPTFPFHFGTEVEEPEHCTWWQEPNWIRNHSPSIPLEGSPNEHTFKQATKQPQPGVRLPERLRYPWACLSTTSHNFSVKMCTKADLERLSSTISSTADEYTTWFHLFQDPHCKWFWTNGPQRYVEQIWITTNNDKLTFHNPPS